MQDTGSSFLARYKMWPIHPTSRTMPGGSGSSIERMCGLLGVSHRLRSSSLSVPIGGLTTPSKLSQGHEQPQPSRLLPATRSRGTVPARAPYLTRLSCTVYYTGGSGRRPSSLDGISCSPSSSSSSSSSSSLPPPEPQPSLTYERRVPITTRDSTVLDDWRDPKVSVKQEG
ncbi:uncharacterized protein BO66DRAFT_141897 [Aspergillus aculeatinus CBS 121060]|uniref:Uncharacterized protein n=1 Tax=Aspergillus aculeatinus CBS 121060 TaxID=1448322 RepID=A0ACD1HKP5_9EURO|nr:hypothetical protein BO66DRAFT_141897 [Aspergillus aculeatinus CBS 121060]RAH74091.1 hypothetical protein BO66DRAFT_141897 [Aspergillus aculeatinus CBS 121060]